MCRPPRGSSHHSPLPAGTVRAERFVLGSHCAMPGQGRTEQNRYLAVIKPHSLPICSVFAHLPLQLSAHMLFYHSFIRLLLPPAQRGSQRNARRSTKRRNSPSALRPQTFRARNGSPPLPRYAAAFGTRRWEQSSAVGVRGRRGSARLGAAAAPLPLTTPRALPARGWDYSAPPPGSPQPLTLRTPGPALTTCRAAADRGPGTRPPPPPP